MSQIFISYSHKDKTYVHHLHRYLLNQGFDAWIDDRMDYGSRWPSEIEEHIKGCSVFILVMSSFSRESEWVQSELLLARELKKPIIPLLLEGNIWWQVQTILSVDVKGGIPPPSKFFVRLAEIALHSQAPNHLLDVKLVTPDKSKLDDLRLSDKVGNDIPHSDNKIKKEIAAPIKLPEKRVDVPNLKVEKSEPPPKKIMPRKLNTTIVVALIGLVGTIFTALLSSPLFEKMFISAPLPTVSLTVTMTPLKPILSLTSDKTMTLGFTPTIISTITPSLTPTLVPTPITSNVFITESDPSPQNCRVTPNTQGEVIEKIASGTNLLAFGRNENSDWLYVKSENIERYCWINISGVNYQASEIARLPLGVIFSKGVEMDLIPSGMFTMGDYVETLVNACKRFDNVTGHCDRQIFYDIFVKDTDISPFYIDKYEVSNLQYKNCVDAGICNLPTSTKSQTRDKYFGNSQYDTYPVIYVTWEMANTYCQEWRGERLPSEAEWEKASRGTDERLFPWGNEFTGKEANFCDKYCDKSINYDDGSKDTSPVTSYTPGISPYGVYNMSGNVWEWVNDQYADDYRMVFRGGAWNFPIYSLFSSNRGNNSRYFSENNIGFRCASDATP